MMDFELASINAFQSRFPSSSLSGCYFHLRQSMHRKLQNLGHQSQYQNDPTFAHNIHKITALAFLPPDSVITGFELLCDELGEQYDTILDYFEETYIGKLRSNRVCRKPMFEIKFWNMHNRTTQSSMRTNNSAEAYHRRINSIVQCSHPTLWLFLQKLIDEENVVHANLIQINAGEPPKKKKTNERLDRRLINLLNDGHRKINVQLDSLAHNIIL